MQVILLSYRPNATLRHRILLGYHYGERPTGKLFSSRVGADQFQISAVQISSEVFSGLLFFNNIVVMALLSENLYAIKMQSEDKHRVDSDGFANMALMFPLLIKMPFAIVPKKLFKTGESQ